MPEARRRSFHGILPPTTPSILVPVFVLLVALHVPVASTTVTAGDGQPSAVPAVSPSDAGSVFVSGVDDRFVKVREAIAKAKRDSGRDYRVFVLGAAGEGRDAARRALKAIVDRWTSSEAPGFDASSDIAILLDVGSRGIAYRAPAGLEVAAGLDEETIRQRLIEAIFVPRAKDGLLDDGLADLVNATETWIKDRQDDKERQEQERAKAVERARVFRTRTLPMGLAAAAGVGGLAALILQRSRHDRAVHEARAKLDAFKGEVVALSDLLDAQQERHRMLPHSDPDFRTPMEGLTRTAYDGVQQSVRRYRERWLSLMDVWERAQAEIDAEWSLGTASAKKAMELLDAAESRPPLDEVAAACRVPLDSLESAHETARETASRLTSSIATAKDRAASLSTRGRSSASFQATLTSVERGLSLATAVLEADPVAARGRLDESEATLAGMVGRLERLEGIDDRSKRAADEIGRIAAKVAARRAEGWLMTEPGADPDHPIAEARAQIETAFGLLDAGELDSAERHVARAEQLAADADSLIESVVAAKARAEELLPQCEARLGPLAARHGEAETAVARMEAAFDGTSWRDVADNIDKASEGLARARELVAAARTTLAPGQQHYFRGVALAEEAVRQEDWVEACYAAVIDRRTELEELRQAIPGRTEAVARRGSELLASLARQRTDRIRANERAHEAETLVRAAADRFSQPKPDLRQVAAMLEAADQAVGRATELAEEDDRLANQAMHEIEETENQIRRIASWYEEGVSADVHGPSALCEQAKALLGRQRYEEAIKMATEASAHARRSYAAAAGEAAARRQRRLDQIRQRQLEESFARMTRGAGPWVIQLPAGRFSGPDPWRTVRLPGGPGGGVGSSGAGSSRTASSNWSDGTVHVNW